MIPYRAYILGMALLCGCVSPTHHGLCHVGRAVLARTGYDLAPPIPAAEVVFADWVDGEDGLSEDEAIAIGLWNNPAYQELLADLQIARADLIQAAQLQNPQISTLFPLGPKQWELALQVPLDVLWLRPLRVSAAELESYRVAERLVQDGLNVVRDIRLAYIDWALAVQRAQLAEQGAALRGEIARIAEVRLAAGDVSVLDVSAIRLDALVGTGEAARAARDAELAFHRLRYVLGLPHADVRIVPAPAVDVGAPQFDVEQLVGEAVSSRADLQAIQLAVRAAQQRSELARRDIWQLSGLLPDINSGGAKGWEAGPGLQFALPLFHQNQGATARAAADAERLRRQLANRRDMAALEVRQAYTQLVQAETDLAIWRDRILPQARDAVASSQRALNENAVSMLLVLETTRQLLTAQQREREADAQMRRAVAELERSVGRRLVAVDTDEPAGPGSPLVREVDVGEATP